MRPPTMDEPAFKKVRCVCLRDHVVMWEAGQAFVGFECPCGRETWFAGRNSSGEVMVTRSVPIPRSERTERT